MSLNKNNSQDPLPKTAMFSEIFQSGILSEFGPRNSASLLK